MKKLLIFLCLTLTHFSSYSQSHYVCVQPTFAFNTNVHDTKNFIGGGVEIGKDYGQYSLGVYTGVWSMDLKTIYNMAVISVPLKESNFSLSGFGGYFYGFKDVTIGYSVNYSLDLNDESAIMISFGEQSAFEQISKYFSIGIEKDF